MQARAGHVEYGQGLLATLAPVAGDYLWVQPDVAQVVPLTRCRQPNQRGACGLTSSSSVRVPRVAGCLASCTASAT